LVHGMTVELSKLMLQFNKRIVSFQNTIIQSTKLQSFFIVSLEASSQPTLVGTSLQLIFI